MVTLIDVEEMRTKMRIKETDDHQARMSKKISYVVRYGVPDIDKVEHNGTKYYKLKQVLNLNIFQGVSEETLLKVVDRANHQKTRYEIIEIGGENCIKAAGQRATDPVERAALKAQKREKKKALKEVMDASVGKKGLSEEEKKAKLDPIGVTQKLLDLPMSQKENVVINNPNVPNEDHSKLFADFCKRFKGKGFPPENNHHPHNDSSKDKVDHPVADAMPFCPGVPWFSTHGNTMMPPTPHLSALQAAYHEQQQRLMYGAQLGMQNMAMRNLYHSMYYNPMAAAAFYMQNMAQGGIMGNPRGGMPFPPGAYGYNKAEGKNGKGKNWGFNGGKGGKGKKGEHNKFGPKNGAILRVGEKGLYWEGE